MANIILEMCNATNVCSGSWERKAELFFQCWCPNILPTKIDQMTFILSACLTWWSLSHVRKLWLFIVARFIFWKLKQHWSWLTKDDHTIVVYFYEVSYTNLSKTISIPFFANEVTILHVDKIYSYQDDIDRTFSNSK